MVDFLTKKRVRNEGEIQQYYIEDDHEAIIEPWIWECVQLEMKRRERYLEDNITRFSQNTEANPFSSKIICGECNRAFARKGWRTPSGDRKVWQCSEWHKVKDVLRCGNRHIYEETLIEIYLMAWNRLLECREMLMPEWERKMPGEDLLAKFRAKDFMEITKDAQPIKELDIDLMIRTVDYIKVYKNGAVMTVFLDGTEIE
ncbi:zinc ribbon domain-containing protein [[Clostridium] scindens]|uniref:zinc ribbon domain-containing protein n=1 Tax=Clostridium scindens (strain JCM 10418 / VPI 12708) TaxID=29347 RepID=UPI002ED56392